MAAFIEICLTHIFQKMAAFLFQYLEYYKSAARTGQSEDR